MSAIAVTPAVPVHGARRRQAATVGSRTRTAPAGTVGELRLTRRGRLVVWALALAVLAGVGGATLDAYADGPVAATEVVRVVVGPGDTLWGIASDAAAPGEDVRDVVLRLMALNELPTGALQAGQTIVVPVR